jgi:hypothetical protein
MGMQAVSDAFMSLFHMIAAIAMPEAFATLATAAFIYLMLFSVLEMRFMLVIWKARRPEAFANGWDAVRRELGTLYCRFYLALLAGMAIIYADSAFGARAILVMSTSFWLPQIVHSVQHDVRPGLTKAYVLGASVARLALPLYMLGCPSSIYYWRLAPLSRAESSSWPQDPASAPANYPWSPPAGTSPADAGPHARELYASGLRFVVGITVWMAIQVLVLLLQNRPGWGPRFFVPAAYLPTKYDYHRAVSVSEGRVLPAPHETAAWMRSRARAAAAAEGGAPAAPGAAGAGAQTAAAGNAAARLSSRAQQWARRRYAAAREWVTDVREGAVWFARCTGVFLGEVAAALRRRTGGRINLPAPQSTRGGVRYARLDATTDGASITDGESTARAEDAAEHAGNGSSSGQGGRTGAAADLDAARALEAAEEGRAPPPEAVRTAVGAARAAELAQVVGTNADAGATDCVVCMDTVAFPIARGDYMVTPCDHLFHAGCLQPWLNNKLECPTCRMQLPEP